MFGAEHHAVIRHNLQLEAQKYTIYKDNQKQLNAKLNCIIHSSANVPSFLPHSWLNQLKLVFDDSYRFK
jgi:hypothetical protein